MVDSSSSLSRKQFLRLTAHLGGAAALAAFLESCSQAGIDPEIPVEPSATAATRAATATQAAAPAPAGTSEPTASAYVTSAPGPTATPNPAAARIALVKTDNRSGGVRQAIELLGAPALAGMSVFIKPNFNSADPTPGSTHPQVLSTLVALLHELGAQKITVGDRSGMGDTRQVMEQLGVFKLAGELGFDALVFDELSPEDWVMAPASESHWQFGFALPRPCLEAQAIVQTCCLKTHRYGGHFTLSLKNSVGLVAGRHPQTGHNFMHELHNSSHQRRMIAEINAAYTPALIVMDGVEAFISGGPDVGELVTPQVVLAGVDRVALDAVGVAILRYFGCQTEAGRGKIFEQEQIARAVELGLGVDNPQNIEFVTGDAESAAYSEAIRAVLLA